MSARVQVRSDRCDRMVRGVTTAVAPRARSPATASAITSACGVPSLMRAGGDHLTRGSSRRQPTRGFGLGSRVADANSIARPMASSTSTGPLGRYRSIMRRRRRRRTARSRPAVSSVRPLDRRDRAGPGRRPPGSSVPNTALPATNTLAPASAQIPMVSASTPPSTCSQTSVSEPLINSRPGGSWGPPRPGTSDLRTRARRS